MKVTMQSYCSQPSFSEPFDHDHGIVYYSFFLARKLGIVISTSHLLYKFQVSEPITCMDS